MADSFTKLKELDLTREEVERIGEALKKEEFRKLLVDYVEEVQDPENKKLYQREIIQLEKERGVDVTFINPNPGYVIKSSVDGSKKCFINVCSNDNIGRPSSVNAGGQGLQWSVPHCLAPPREDLDNKGVRCLVYDAVFHPDTLRLATKSKSFYNMVNTTACEAIESNFEVTLDKKNLKFPKMQYKGLAHAAVIRKPIQNFVAEDLPLEEREFLEKLYPKAEQPIKKKSKKTSNSDKAGHGHTTPTYVIKHRSHVDIQEFVDDKHAKINATTPRELIVEINLPLLKSSSDITLDVTEKTVQLLSEKPSKYKLNLTLPYRVNQDNGTAKFDKDLKKLIITLPVNKRNFHDYAKDDSGVESDHGSPTTTETKKFSDCALRTSFLDENCHYDLPEFTCHLFENTLAFTLNVKNVDESSICKVDTSDSIHVKFTSVSSSYYLAHYSFFVKIPTGIQGVQVETWDNNVIVQVQLDCDTIKNYYYGLAATNLKEKFVEEPTILNSVLQNTTLEESVQEESTPPPPLLQEDGANTTGTSYESSGDELSFSYSPSKSKGILKRLSNRAFVGRSISESSLDDYVCSSVDNESAIPEDGEMSASLKKTVRFSDVIMRQLYRSNSSILGQKKKNQRKSRNKKRAQERRHSESEASEGDDKKEEGLDQNDDKSDQDKSDTNSDIFDMDMN